MKEASVRSRHRTLVAFTFAWVAFVAGVYIWTSSSYVEAMHSGLANEVLLRHGLVMLLASAPMGFLVSLVVALALDVAGVRLEGITDAVAVSITCWFGGWLQWCVVMPWAVRKFRRRRVSSSPPPSVSSAAR